MAKHRKVQPPKDQSFKSGFGIEMNHYTIDPETGDRTKFVKREFVRFKTSAQLAAYWNQHRYYKRKRKEDEKSDGQDPATVAAVATLVSLAVVG